MALSKRQRSNEDKTISGSQAYKKRRLNSIKDNTPKQNVSPCAFPLSYQQYQHKYRRKMDFNDTQKHKFVSSLAKIKHLYGHNGCVNTANWEKSGRHLCSGSDDQTIRFWDVFGIKYDGNTPKTLCILKGHLSNVFSAKFMFNSSVFGINNHIVSGGNDADIHIFDVNHSPNTFKPYQAIKSRAKHKNSLFIHPMRSFHHHSRKILKVCTHSSIPFEIFSCSADGTVRHFDVRQKYKSASNQFIHSSNTQNIITQSFGGGIGSNRGRFSQSLLYDFNQFNRHWTVYSVDVNPINPNQILTSCEDGFIRIFDLRKRNNECIDSVTNSTSAFYNFQITYPQTMHPTDAVYNNDGSEILSTHIRDACYLFVNPTTINQAQTVKRIDFNDQSQQILDFLNSEDDDDISEDVGPRLSDFESESEGDLESVDSEVLNVAVVSRLQAQEFDENDEEEFEREIDDLIEIGANEEFMDYVQTLVERRKEVLRLDASENNFQDVLYDLVSKRELKLIALQSLDFGESDKMKLLDLMSEREIKCMKWEISQKCDKNDEKMNDLLPPIDSNMDIQRCYHNKYYDFFMDFDKLNHDLNGNQNVNGMNIGQEIELHDFSKKVHYFGRYFGHVHCETIKGVSFFGDNYIVTGSDDKCIYIYDRLSGDIVNILDNECDTVNNIATHPHLPIFASSGLDSHVTIWGPRGWNREEEDDGEEDIDRDDEDIEFKHTQQIVENIIRLRPRAGFDVL